jgi:hypothetical protein
MQNPNNPFWHRTHDLPACSVMREPTASPRHIQLVPAIISSGVYWPRHEANSHVHVKPSLQIQQTVLPLSCTSPCSGDVLIIRTFTPSKFHCTAHRYCVRHVAFNRVLVLENCY